MDVNQSYLDESFKGDLLIKAPTYEELEKDLRASRLELEEAVKNKEQLLIVNKEYITQIEDLKEQNNSINTKLEELKLCLKELETSVQALKSEKEQLENKNKDLMDSKASQTKTEEIFREEDEFDDLQVTPTKHFPRQSIGQWSMERKKRNLSVKSLVSSLENQKRRT